MLDAPKEMLDERRRLGQDGRDEMWDGVLHVVPPAGGPHQRLSGDVYFVLRPLAERRGLVSLYETGLFDDEANYRVPDLLFCRSEHLSDRGAEGADIVVEVRSPDDESYAKLDFYAARGVREVLVLHPKGRRVELFRTVDGQMTVLSRDASGAIVSDVLGISFATVDGKLRITWPEGSAEI